MRKEFLPRCEAKVYEGSNTDYRIINERHLLYSNIFNMKDTGNGLDLTMMRNIKFYYPRDNDFRYVKFDVDRFEHVESDLGNVKRINL
jgi:hypothetical protein